MGKRLKTKGKEMYSQTPDFRLNKKEKEKPPVLTKLKKVRDKATECLHTAT